MNTSINNTMINNTATDAAIIGNATNDNTLVGKLAADRDLSDDELTALVNTDRYDALLFAAADRVRRSVYGADVYVRGLIEISNHCKNNCYYCGIRRDNAALERYRLDANQIIERCVVGYDLGFRTFVLQGGEDPFYDDDVVCEIVSSIKKRYDDCAITLSLGERARKSYQKLFDAGADRYLLRHETADDAHYRQLHPADMSLDTRKTSLYNLREIGFQVGSGFMVGSPYQTTAHIIKDLRFLQKLQPDMIGVGPYITHKDTPFRDHKSGSLELTLRVVAILRLLFPYALIPATTALGTIAPNGRELGLQAGANVVMPNLSPLSVRKQYALYDGKICTGEEAAECKTCLERRVESAGYKIVVARGDVKKPSSDFC